MKITFLGTGCMIPTKERNHFSVFMKYRKYGILVDCGEGTQRQMKIARIRPSKVTHILITHWHADHIIGLPGLIQTLDKSEIKSVNVYGPIGTKKYFRHLFKGFSTKLDIKVHLKEIGSGKFLNEKDFYIEALRLKHKPTCLGYAFVEKNRRKIDKGFLRKYKIRNGPVLKKLQQGKNIVVKGKRVFASKATRLIKGRKIAFILDTGMCDNTIRLAKNADLLICESSLSEKQATVARRYNHLTAKKVGVIARKAKVKELILTHISQRYKDPSILLKEVKFKGAKISKDFMEVKI